MTFRILLTLSISLGFANLALAGGGNPLDALMTADMAYKGANFLLLLILLHLFVKKPLTNMLKASAIATKDKMESSKKEVEQKKAELEEFKKSLIQLDQELSDRKQKAVESIEQEKTRILEDAKAQAAHIEEAANKRIEQNIAKAKAEIRTFLAEEAAKQAEEKIQKEFNKSKQESLMKSYISTLDA